MKDLSYNLSGKIFVVSGANGQLGQSLCDYLKGQNAIVVELDICFSKEELQEEVLRFNVDLNDKKRLFEFTRDLVGKLDRIDGLVNFASNNPKSNQLQNVSALSQVDVKSGLADIELAFKGTVNLIAAFEELLFAGDSPSIVLIGSDLSLISPDQRIYCNCTNNSQNHSSECGTKPISYTFEKFGIVGMAKYLATFYAAKGIRVNCFCPGPVDIGIRENVRARLMDLIPLGRLAAPSDVHGPVHFLLSDMSKFMTGSVLVADGGRTCL